MFFPFPIVPRECIVKLSEDTNIEKAIKEINKIRFGAGRLQAKKNLSEEQRLNIAPEEIDPFTLYFGNLPHSKISELKIILKNAQMQFGQNKRKPKSYAFATFNNFEDAVLGFNKCTKKFPPSNFITIRFKRKKTKEVDENSQDSIRAASPAPIEQNVTASSTPKNSENVNENSNRRQSKRKTQKKDKIIENETVEQSQEQNETSVNGDTTTLNSATNGDKSQNTQNDTRSEQYDPNIKIKEEPDLYLGFRRVPYTNDLDGDTDCSESTFKSRSNSVDSNGIRKRRTSDDSVLAISDSDDELQPKMKKPKLLVLPMELHGSLREVKDEDKDSTDDEIDDIQDMDFI